MKNILNFNILGTWFLSLLFWGQSKEGESNFAAKNSNTLKTDTVIAKTCTDCHAVLFEKKIKHTTETGKDCEDCHKSNGSEHPKTGVAAFSLAEKLPNLCLTCHDDFKNKITNSPVIHQAVNDKKSCVYCHSPHSSAEKKLLVANRKELCLSCHNKTIPVTAGTKSKTLSNIEQQDKNSKVFHPLFKKCSPSCHNPHASANYSLLNVPFSSDTYLPVNKDSFALCWECHDAELFETAKTTTATNFRDGDKNLHYVHIHGEKGRNCMMCHSPHATKNEHLIKDKVKFGEWEFRMNYTINETGGSCFPGCHKEKTYTR